MARRYIRVITMLHVTIQSTAVLAMVGTEGACQPFSLTPALVYSALIAATAWLGWEARAERERELRKEN